MALIRLIYLSSAVKLMSEAELAALVAEARRFNAGHDISGMLLYADGNFLQVLEGAAQEVDGLFARIQRDPRHRNIVLLERVAIARREFAGWDMGFHHLAIAGGDALPDWLANLPGAPLPPPHAGMELLQHYARQNEP